jgi:hypothetical protein
MTVIVRPSAQAGLVELQVGGAVALLDPAEARALAAALLVESDRAEGLPPIDLEAMLDGGGG